jgi:hypothetical protein
MKNLHFILSTLLVLSILFTSCEKEYVAPKSKAIPMGNILTIAEVRALEIPGTEVSITEDLSVYGVVTMDASTGNIYKESYITDATGNLYLRFISSTGLYEGDSVRVNLKGSKILRYNQMLQVDSLHPDNSVTKIATQAHQTPEVTTIANLVNDMEAAQGKLVQLDYTWFVEGGQGKTYADAANLNAVSRVLQDLNGAQIDVRTSGYANFANDTIPSGVGTFIGVVAQYNSGLQLLIRDPNELSLNGVAPILVLNKNFDDQSLTSGGWTDTLISGVASCSWGIYAAANSAAKISNNPNLACESWLISPTIDLTGANNASIDFRNTIRFDAEPQLQLMVSTNFTGMGDPNVASWTDITGSATWDVDDASWNFVSSGSVDLSTFAQANVHVAFKFIGTNTTSVTWEVDEINIYK